MIFPNFNALVDYINKELGVFVDEFAIERKRLAEKGRLTKRGILFGFDESKERTWAINKGGGIEVQYHIGIDYEDLIIRYGLGFNTQYVPYANDKTMVEYAKPYMDAFLRNEPIIKQILPDYSFVYGHRGNLANPQDNQFTLFGKNQDFDGDSTKIDIDDAVIATILADLKRQFVVYKLIFETKNKQPNMDVQSALITNLLKYKKQIILQGPPGTGKTKLAKEIAKQLVTPSTITEAEIKECLFVGLKFNSANNDTEYIIKEIGDVNVKVGIKRSTNEYKPSLKEIAKAYEIKMWDGKQENGNDPYAAAIAKYVYAHLPNVRFKVVQFHPSFTYEDFIRGIITESKGDRIEYRNVNKIFASFAEEAKTNWEEHHKDVINVSREKRVQQYFTSFVEALNEQIEEELSVKITEKVSLVDIEEDAFRYKGSEGWSVLGLRMLFKDIVQAFLDNNSTRQDVKNNKNLSGLANHHASYFVKVLNRFQDYLKNNHLTFDNLSTDRPPLKNFVLIIDEINRANLSSVFGELIYALEYRNEKVESMYAVDGVNELSLPNNLFIIGTMNTADRSVGHIDYAIRRRFAFVDVPPKDLSATLGDAFHKDLFDKVSALFKYDSHLTAEFDPADVSLGHSYFIDKAAEGGTMSVRLNYEIIPLLEEYIKDGILKDSVTLRKEIEELQNIIN